MERRLGGLDVADSARWIADAGRRNRDAE